VFPSPFAGIGHLAAGAFHLPAEEAQGSGRQAHHALHRAAHHAAHGAAGLLQRAHRRLPGGAGAADRTQPAQQFHLQHSQFQEVDALHHDGRRLYCPGAGAGRTQGEARHVASEAGAGIDSEILAAEQGRGHQLGGRDLVAGAARSRSCRDGQGGGQAGGEEQARGAGRGRGTAGGGHRQSRRFSR
jgi:hypothetical protein